MLVYSDGLSDAQIRAALLEPCRDLEAAVRDAAGRGRAGRAAGGAARGAADHCLPARQGTGGGMTAGRVIVVGSSNTDMIVRAERLPLPGETVLGGDW